MPLSRRAYSEGGGCLSLRLHCAQNYDKGLPSQLEQIGKRKPIQLILTCYVCILVSTLELTLDTQRPQKFSEDSGIPHPLTLVICVCVCV